MWDAFAAADQTLRVGLDVLQDKRAVERLAEIESTEGRKERYHMALMMRAKRVMRTESAAPHIERELDDNERAQHRSQREQNGSEVRSVELERLAFVLLAKHTYP